MSAVPPPEDPTQPRQAGDGVEMSVTRARGAERTGRAVWILGISLFLAVVLVIGYWLTHAPRLHALNDARAVGSQNITGYPVQDASPRPSPGPGQAPAAGNDE